MLNPSDEGRITAFSALQSHRSVTQVMGQVGAGKDLFVAEAIALHPFVPAPETAVEAVLFADIAKFDQPPEMHIVVQVAELDFPSALEKALLLRTFRRQENLDFFLVEVLLAEYVIKYRSHNVTVSFSEPFKSTHQS